MNKKILKLVPAAVVLTAGIVYLGSFRGRAGSDITVSVPEEAASEIQSEDVLPEQQGIWICISGHVKNPGVYYLPEGSRLFEAVDMAGGMSQDAAEGSVNLALKLSDAQQIYVPGISETVPEAAAHHYSESDGLVNINTASEDELKTLPGIGDSKARAIIDYRNKSPFVHIEDIMNVSGIKENSFEKIRNQIKV